MPNPLHLIQNIDISVYYWLSRFHGNWFSDRFVAFQESNALLKCGLLTSMYWYFWFREGSEQKQTRIKILTILTGTLAGIVFTRVIATLVPFRVRPMYAVNFQHPLSIPTPTGFMDWSSFPSDHAAYLCALGFGLIWLSRRCTTPVVLFLAAWVCFPRMYLGIHYASDLLAGAAIGVVTVWAALKAKWLESHVIRPVLAFAEAKPQFFYTVAFLTMFEMTTLFWDIQSPIHKGLYGLSLLPHHKAIEITVVFLICACGIIAFNYHDVTRDENLPTSSVMAKIARAGRA
jgi:undecaprenyl-diphosphatase